jgi:hypothetical protein
LRSFPSRQEFAAYWETVADDALRYLGRRPLKLVRHVKGTTFYPMGPLPEIPPAVRQLRLEKRKGCTGTRLWVEDLAGLLGLVEIGVVEIRPWGATIEDIGHPDTLVFDLDPGEGVEWGFVVETGFRLRDMLAEEGLDCWPNLHPAPKYPTGASSRLASSLRRCQIRMNSLACEEPFYTLVLSLLPLSPGREPFSFALLPQIYSGMPARRIPS